MISDADLLRRYVTEDSHAAFRELVSRHIDAVYRAALRQVNGDTHLAEEVTQVAFTTLAQKARRLPPGVILIGWLHATTHYAVANVRRAEARRRGREQAAFLMQHDESGSEDAVWNHVRPVLDELLCKLRRIDREAVMLRYFEGRSYREIAAALSLSEDASRMRVDRAVEQLRQLLARRGIASTAAALGGLLANQAGFAAPASLKAAIAEQALSAAAGAGGLPASGVLHRHVRARPYVVDPHSSRER